MKSKHLPLASCFIALLMVGSTVFAAAPNAALLKAKQQAESAGYTFVASRDDIVAAANKEGRLRVLASQDSALLKVIADQFRKKYPLIDVSAEEVAGGENFQRMLQEMKAGLAKDWDVNFMHWPLYPEYLPYQKKFDILGMAEHGVLRMNARMVDPVHRNVVALQSNVQVTAYNRKFISRERVPDTLEDFLKPEFKERKFALDIRSKALPLLVPFWGLEKVLDVSRRLTAQNPVWFRGDARARTQMAVGEIRLAYGLNYSGVKYHQEKDPSKTIEYKLTEPVPVRLTEAQAVLATAAHPHAALLWLEFQASPEGQKILDQEDLAASLFTPGSVHEQLTKGKNVSLVSWDHFQKVGDYEKKIVEALGFPRAEK
jgi:ABC-type Fe3+ transport system substrate-binding protein